jgi:hypothetical protein
MHGLENSQNHLNKSYGLSSWLGSTSWNIKGMGWFFHSSSYQFV